MLRLSKQFCLESAYSNQTACFIRGVFSRLASLPEFRKVHVVDGVATWPGDLELAPDAMYAEIKRSGEWLLN
jgi:hypothetical protein